jgi:hypothetical protein
VLAGATSSFGDTRPDHAHDDAVATIGAVLLCRAMLARHNKKFTCWGLTSPMTRADHFRSICSSLPHAAQLTGHLDLCELFGLDDRGEWEPKCLDDDLALWSTPVKSSSRSRHRASVPAAVAMLARRTLYVLHEIAPEGFWRRRGQAIPFPEYASFEELRQAAIDVLLRRDTAARRNHPVFQMLLHPPDFAVYQAEPRVNRKLVRWLEDWEVLFWEWHRGAACEFGLCRVPPAWEFDDMDCAANIAHPFFTCPLDKLDARNIWVVPAAPNWYQDMMLTDVLDPADPQGSRTCCLRRLIYSAAVELASLVPAASVLRFRPPAPGGPTLPQPDGVTHLDSEEQCLHNWFCPVDPLLPSALALCPTLLAFFRLRFAPFLLSHQAEEEFWRDLPLQGRMEGIPDAVRPLALYRLCSDGLVKDSLGPAPWHVACVDAADCLWAWQWSDALTLEDGFPGDTGPWAAFGDSSDPPAVEFFDYDDLGIDDDDFG